MKLCTQCATENSDNAITCNKCGSALPMSTTYPSAQSYSSQTPAQQAPPPQQAYQQPQQGYAPPPQQNYQQPPKYPPPPPGYQPQAYAAAPPPKKSNAWKWILGIVGVLGLCFVLVIVAAVMVFNKAKHKVQSAFTESGGITTAAPIVGDACRYLSAEEVSKAIGVKIVEAKSTTDGCQYLAEGTYENMTAKHLSEMTKGSGATPEQQKMIEQMATGLFNNNKSKDAEAQDATGKSPVLVFSIDGTSARMQMNLNSKILGQAPGSRKLMDVGDEAFIASNAILMVRKGDRLVRFELTACPCSSDAVVPLAKKIADQL